jgi:site-specific recombinase XerD
LAQKKTKRGALFLTEVKKTRIRQNDVLVAVHMASKRAGLSESIMPKTLRHSYGTHLMDAGIDLALIASLMGHKSPNESGVYLHALPGTKELAVRRVEISESLTSAIYEDEEEEVK